jgi:Zn-dependent M28 family amino/carboxypeptidase
VNGGAIDQNLARHVGVLAGDIGERNVFCPAALQAAADYITAQWEAQGWLVGEQAYVAQGVRSANLEVVVPGTGAASEIVLLGAHYDSVVGSPGANDNASGVAALLEIARCLAGRQFRRTVRLVAFVNEEPPFFFWGNMGSMVYAKAARARGDDIRLMLSLETMGCYRDEPGSQRYPPLFRRFHPDRGNFIAFVSNFRSRPALRTAVAAFRASSDFPVERTATFGWIPGVAWSDHYAFWRQGYQALMVTDTAFFRYPWYHTSEDTPEKLDYARLAQVTAGLCGAVAALAGEEGRGGRK